METFENKVAVITGAASGIGRALAARCLQEGMKVVLADVEEEALAQTAAQLDRGTASILAAPTDVSKVADMEALAQQAQQAFGEVHLLFNNAGVGGGGTIWESTLAEWEWVLGVNLWGTIHGLRVFVPMMLAQNTECHIVNSASLAGLLPYHPSAPYQVTKQGIVALSEQLYYSLKQQQARIDVSVLCPAVVKTGILDSTRNRPFVEGEKEGRETAVNPTNPAQLALLQRMRQATKTGMKPEVVAAHVFDAIRRQQFYILTHPQFNTAIEAKTKQLLHKNHPPDFFSVIGYCLKGE